MTTVRVTRRAEQQLRRIDEWWRANRTAAPDLFLNELGDSFELIGTAPAIGRPYTSAVPGVRRVLLRATRYHVYYRSVRDEVVVLAVWSAVRGRGPRL